MTAPVHHELERWSIDRLTPYARNARTHSAEQVAKIAASIREYGFTNPILVAPDGEIVAGHGRLSAARTLGLTEVPVIVLANLTAAQRRAYVLADNRLPLDAGWDEALLAAELTALSADDVDLALTGFGDDELAALLGDAADSEAMGKDAEEGGAEERPFAYQEKYAVLVMCADEGEQERIYSDLQSRGLQVKVLVN